MFESETHLPQALRAEHYVSPEYFDRELQRLFLPGWHLAASSAELPRDGCFVTLKLFDRPLVVWRTGDSYQTYLNICPHRFSTVVCEASGEADRLRCPYHGWEFGRDGSTCRIPDAPSFRPLTGQHPALRAFRTERVGQLIFTTLSDSAPDLRTYLGPGYAMCEEVFSSEWVFSKSRNRRLDCNWKLFMENSIESYHIPTVHPKTFREWPAEESMRHDFGAGWSRLHTTGRAGQLDRLDRLAHWAIGLERQADYITILCYPGLLIGRMSMYSWIDSLVPERPGQVLVRARSFQRVGPCPTWRRRIAAAIVSRLTERFIDRLLPEDADILTRLQQSFCSPEFPGSGLISRREERIHHFQRYVLDAVGDGLALRLTGSG